MRQCLHCGAPVEGEECWGCGSEEPFVLHLQGRGRRTPLPAAAQLIFDGEHSRWITEALLVLARKEDWRCHLCGLPVPHWCPQGHAAAPSRDHVIPRRWERGLTENVKLAHAWCNSHRKDLPMASIDRLEFREGMLARVPELRRAA